MDGHDCILPFDTHDPAFARGFEAGRLWGLLQARPDAPVRYLLHANNAEMALRMAEAAERAVRAEIVDDAWIEATYAPAGEAEFVVGEESAE